jgi:hypothetical protein
LANEAIVDLLHQAPISFIGTVERLGAATTTAVQIDEQTAVVRVDQVLQAPQMFGTLVGQRVTLQLAADREPPQAGQTSAFFAQGLAFGETVALQEVGRLPVEDVEPQVSAAFEAGEPQAFSEFERQVEQDRLRAHVDEADAVVVGRVTKLEDAIRPSISEHDPDWWRATLDVVHVERGDVEPGELAVLYPNSLDVQWRLAPKPKASQEGLWILHATEGELREAAPFQILHAEDFQPVQSLDTVREG